MNESVFHIDPYCSVESLREFVALPEAKRNSVNLLSGHMQFGAHKYVSCPFTYITFLRNPLERLPSLYYYIKNYPDHYLHQRANINEMSLGEFASSRLADELDNGMTRALSGLHSPLSNRPEFGFSPCSQQHYKKAVENLETYFSAVGIMESFDASLMIVKNVLQWPKLPYYVMKNVNSKHSSPIGSKK